tara:strand:+ start:230 stop:907 length:678 start_codon:yes stop_codon:yes gene_type:complete
MNFSKNFLIIAPHPDDEILGCGGLISKINANKGYVTILTVCNHLPPLYKMKQSVKTLKEMAKAHKFLGVNKSINLKYPACLLFKQPQYKINNLILEIILKHKPEYIFIPFPDRHQDHKIVFESAMVASRPKSNLSFINSIFSYEVVSETFWNATYIEPNFQPDTFINIEKEINKKIKALNIFKSQVNQDTYERSLDAIKALSILRGSQNGFKYAESFKLIRSRIS